MGAEHQRQQDEQRKRRNCVKKSGNPSRVDRNKPARCAIQPSGRARSRPITTGMTERPRCQIKARKSARIPGRANQTSWLTSEATDPRGFDGFGDIRECDGADKLAR